MKLIDPIPKYCQPNLIKRLFNRLSPTHCLYCQYTRGLGCKLYVDQDGTYYLKAKEIGVDQE